MTAESRAPTMAEIDLHLAGLKCEAERGYWSLRRWQINRLEHGGNGC